MCQHSRVERASVQATVWLMSDGSYRLIVTSMAHEGPPSVEAEEYEGLTLPEAIQVVDLETARFFADPF